MTDTRDFLFELGTEELPPKALLRLSTQFRDNVTSRVKSAGLRFESVQAFATPRRLAVKIFSLAAEQPDQQIERRGPAVSAAFNDAGEPTKAALGFAKSCGVEVAALDRMQTDKGEWLSYHAEVKGEAAKVLMPSIITKALSDLPIPKPMRWGSGDTEFVRPVHWVVMIYGAEVFPATILGVVATNITRGHRFLSNGDIQLSSTSDYPSKLETEGFVIANFEERKRRIEQIVLETVENDGATAIIDRSLLNEVCALVEWPAPIYGSFDPHFLELPREVLIASMQDHQKYFPVEGRDGELINKFISISNITSQEPEAVRQGNERVIRPRLSDADFFWRQDRKTKLVERASILDGIVYQEKLGSLKNKSDRVAVLAAKFADNFVADRDHCERASILARCDLTTDMVNEFPELQGVMGAYYARADGEDEAIVDALSAFYQPRFAGDDIPPTPIGRCIAYADKIDSLVGIFAVGLAPTGDKDPYALRRAALGSVRIIIESNTDIDLKKSIEIASESFSDVDAKSSIDDVHRFVIERLRGYFADNGYRHSVVEAVFDCEQDSPNDIARRIKAVSAFRELPQAESIAAANKRIGNILRKSGIDRHIPVNDSLLVDAAEQSLASEMSKITAEADRLFEKTDYAGYLVALAKLHDPINRFFDEVMVMCEDEKTRANRLALLHALHAAFSRVANVARLND